MIEANVALTIALIGGLITLAVAALQMRQMGKANYVKELENWIVELKSQLTELKTERLAGIARFEAKNASQDAAIAKLEEAVDRCERERQAERTNYIFDMFKLRQELDELKGRKQ